MKLTNENYYSLKADNDFLSVSQYKNFFGSLGFKGCEAKAIAKLKGDWVEETTPAMLIGSYVDSYFEGSLEEFKNRTPQLLKKDGTLKAEYIQAESIIKRIERDKKFMQYLSGEKQTIFTGELFGVNWKAKLDSYIKGKAIVDLKIVRDITERCYIKGIGEMNFIQYWGYDFQLAIYQKLVEINTGEKLPCFIAAADKGKTTNIEVIQITQPELDCALVGVQIGVDRIKLLKSGTIEPERCKKCDYCKETKVIDKPVLMSSLIEG